MTCLTQCLIPVPVPVPVPVCVPTHSLILTYHEQRKADMSPVAGAAMRDVLNEVSMMEVAKWPIANRFHVAWCRQRGWVRIPTSNP